MTGDRQHDATTEFNEALAAGFAAGDFDALGSFFTEDASLLPPRGRLLEGRPAVPAFWLGASKRFGSAVFTTVGLKDLGDAARRETGTYAMTGNDGQAVEGKYVFVWQLVDGEWQIESAIWNRNAGDGAGRRQGQAQGRQGGGRGAGQGGGGQRGGQGGYRQGGGQSGYRQGGGQGGGGYRQGGRPSFQAGGGGGVGRRGGGGPGGARQGGGNQAATGGGLYEGDGGLYSNPKG